MVSLPTTKAEFIIVTETINEKIWMTGMTSLIEEQVVPNVFCDC